MSNHLLEELEGEPGEEQTDNGYDTSSVGDDIQSFLTVL